MNGLIGFGSDPSLGIGVEMPGVPSSMTPVTQADLQAALDAQARRNRLALVAVGAGSALVAIGIAVWIARR